jgi:site-specific DNA recombinase
MRVGLSESSRVPEQAKSLEQSYHGERHAVQAGTVSVVSYVPYGYRYVSNQESGGEARFDIDLTEARVVRQIFEWVGRDQCTIDEVQRRLVQAKEQAQADKIVWDRATIWGILKNPAYKGEAVFGKTHRELQCPPLQDQGCGGIQPRQTSSTQCLPTRQWMIIPIPALVDVALFEAVAERLQEYQQRVQSQEQGARYLLQGLIVCRCCGSAYSGKLINQSTSTGMSRLCAYYCCMGTDVDHFNGVQVCGNKQLRTDLVDKVVWNEVCQLLKNPERFEQEYQRLCKEAIGDLCRINDKIEKLRQGRMRLIDSYAEGLIDKTEFEPCITRMQEQIKHLEEQHQNIKNKTGLGKGLSQLLEGLNDFSSHVKDGLHAVDWSTRREIIRAVVKRVEINQEQVRVVFRIGPSTLFSPSEKKIPKCVTV